MAQRSVGTTMEEVVNVKPAKTTPLRRPSMSLWARERAPMAMKRIVVPTNISKTKRRNDSSPSIWSSIFSTSIIVWGNLITLKHYHWFTCLHCLIGCMVHQFANKFDNFMIINSIDSLILTWFFEILQDSKDCWGFCSIIWGFQWFSLILVS